MERIMLVLSRNKNQGIHFPGLGVSVEILEVVGNKVKVGIEAPIEVRILRDELMENDERSEGEARQRLPQSMRNALRSALDDISKTLRVNLDRPQERSDPSISVAIDAEQMFQTIVARLENAGDGNQNPDEQLDRNQERRSMNASIHHEDRKVQEALSVS